MFYGSVGPRPDGRPPVAIIAPAYSQHDPRHAPSSHVPHGAARLLCDYYRTRGAWRAGEFLLAPIEEIVALIAAGAAEQMYMTTDLVRIFDAMPLDQIHGGSR